MVSLNKEKVKVLSKDELVGCIQLCILNKDKEGLRNRNVCQDTDGSRILYLLRFGEG